jgi:hypothetical protein
MLLYTVYVAYDIYIYKEFLPYMIRYYIIFYNYLQINTYIYTYI